MDMAARGWHSGFKVMVSMRRRSFLRLFSLAGVSAAMLEATEVLAAMPGHGPGYAMVIDLRRCVGCQSCTVSCGVENAVPLGEFRTSVNEYAMGATPEDGRSSALAVVPRLCNHCEKPACVPVCPVGATFRREDGLVLIDATKCIGCGFCVQACPYGARFLNRATHTADKCTFCAHRLAAGLLPACVENCVGGARIFGDMRDARSPIRRILHGYKLKVATLYPEKNTQPSVFYIGLDDYFANAGSIPEPLPIYPSGRPHHG
jgi:tetrathionate reductase subunit B